MHNKCLEEYSEEMQKEFERNESIFEEIALLKIHEIIKDKSFVLVRSFMSFFRFFYA